MGNDATLQNGPTFSTDTLTAGQGYSLSFDGSNEYMTIGANVLFDTGSAFSYSGWVKLNRTVIYIRQ
jgi:hypothetical protein